MTMPIYGTGIPTLTELGGQMIRERDRGKIQTHPDTANLVRRLVELVSDDLNDGE